MPWCDGAHSSLEKGRPRVRIPDEAKSALCDCGESATFPFCDQSNSKCVKAP